MKKGLKFSGYRRLDGSVGIRNLVGIISTVTCANQAASDIAVHLPGAAVFTHQQGCGLLSEDTDMVHRTLVNLGRNPNLGAVLVVGLGCESIDSIRVAEEIAAAGKPVEVLSIQKAGGFFAAVAEGGLKAQKLAAEISRISPQPADIGSLKIGIKCGASDPTSGLASNPAVGKAADLLIAAGGSVVFGETTELIGAEHLLEDRCATPEVSSKLFKMIQRKEERVRSAGGDMRGGNPSKGNIEAGLTTIEEKSIGAVVKAGTGKIVDCLEYGTSPGSEKGLYFVDSPGREPELLAALAAAGCQLILFSTGIGAPQGFPFVPVLKVSGNKFTVDRLADFIDIDVSPVMLGGETLESAGLRVLNKTIGIASGEKTKAEIIGYVGSTAIYQNGPIV